MAIAYYNLGVELEHTKDYQQALEKYEQAVAYSANAEPLKRQIAKSIEEVRTKIENQSESHARRQMLRRLKDTMTRF